MSLYYIFAPFILSFIISLLTGKILIPALKSKKLGQKILDIGPRWHKSKEGTPVMGGLLFIFGSLLAVAVFGYVVAVRSDDYRIIITFLMAFAYGIIGFIDDYVKLFKKQNQGLTPIQKLFLQFLIAVVYLFVLKRFNYMSDEVFIPFIRHSYDIGIFYDIFIAFGLVYITNSVNLHDGIDGLCGSVTLIILIFLSVLFYNADDTGGIILSVAMMGGILGFLYYNFYPAKVFMGDTGSLFLGGMVAGMAVWLDIPLLLFLFGVIYIIEGLSSMLQVAGYKMTGKRIFKMAPIHHHFEMCGWSEKKIVAVFSLVTVIGCVISYFGV